MHGGVAWSAGDRGPYPTQRDCRTVPNESAISRHGGNAIRVHPRLATASICSYHQRRFPAACPRYFRCRQRNTRKVVGKPLKRVYGIQLTWEKAYLRCWLGNCSFPTTRLRRQSASEAQQQHDTAGLRPDALGCFRSREPRPPQGCTSAGLPCSSGPAAVLGEAVERCSRECHHELRLDAEG